RPSQLVRCRTSPTSPILTAPRYAFQHFKILQLRRKAQPHVALVKDDQRRLEPHVSVDVKAAKDKAALQATIAIADILDSADEAVVQIITGNRDHASLHLVREIRKLGAAREEEHPVP